MERFAYDITEAAELVSLGRSKVYEEIKAGRIATVTVGRRRLVTRAAIEAYIAQLEEEAA